MAHTPSVPWWWVRVRDIVAVLGRRDLDERLNKANDGPQAETKR
jgi:hypothetical protein